MCFRASGWPVPSFEVAFTGVSGKRSAVVPSSGPPALYRALIPLRIDLGYHVRVKSRIFVVSADAMAYGGPSKSASILRSSCGFSPDITSDGRSRPKGFVTVIPVRGPGRSELQRDHHYARIRTTGHGLRGPRRPCAQTQGGRRRARLPTRVHGDESRLPDEYPDDISGPLPALSRLKRRPTPGPLSIPLGVDRSPEPR